eukprot:Skav227514  [mRNA]  locus=scaffold2269:30777:31367:+ [translate_table: standard]
MTRTVSITRSPAERKAPKSLGRHLCFGRWLLLCTGKFQLVRCKTCAMQQAWAKLMYTATYPQKSDRDGLMRLPSDRVCDRSMATRTIPR